MRFFLLVLSAITFISIQNASAEITCIEAPKCSDLGYDLSAEDCIGRKYTVCPYDSTAYSCDTTTCEDLGYEDNIAECPGEYDVCQYDKTKGKCIYEARPGDLKYSLRTSDHNGWLLCDGRSYLSLQFPELYNAIASSYGKILPNFKDYFIKGAATTSASNLKPEIDYGKEEAGLPNITGFASFLTTTSASDYSSYPTTGAFYWGNINYGSYASTNSGRGLRDLHIDASKSNAIYGKSTTVTPQNYKANVFIYAGKQKIQGELIPDIKDKYIYADGTYSDELELEKEVLGYGLTSTVMIFGGNDPTGGTSSQFVLAAAEGYCSRENAKLAPVALILNLATTDIEYNNGVVPPTLDHEYLAGNGVFGFNSNGGLAQTTFVPNKQYYYYCYKSG